MRQLQLIVLVGLAGAIGSLSRYALATAIARCCETTFPWGTLVVNVLGCLFFGWVWTLAAEQRLSDELRVIALVGFAGAFTTFSTFANDTLLLANHDRHWQAIANIILQNGLGLAAVACGIWCARQSTG